MNLELQENPLLPVESPFLSIYSLLYLDISNCSISKLNQEFFAKLSHLTKLDLPHNLFIEIKQNIFKLLRSLETLKINDCNLTQFNSHRRRFSCVAIFEMLAIIR